VLRGKSWVTEWHHVDEPYEEWVEHTEHVTVPVETVVESSASASSESSTFIPGSTTKTVEELNEQGQVISSQSTTTPN